MMRMQTRFPLVADDELIVGENPDMRLYEEGDLISNIKGPYQDREFGQEVASQAGSPYSGEERGTEEALLPPLFKATPSPYSRKERYQKPVSQGVTTSQVKTQGQLARETAREDLKKKRSASYLHQEPPRHILPEKHQVTAPLVKKSVPQLTALANRLQQTDYILADMPAVYSLQKEDREQEVPVRKNSYDFLRKSQVYNYPERKVQRERRMAQELNLTHMEEGLE
ncbi:hypothetical protein BVE84_02220 [Streptococcus azizii]|uniref:ATP-binding protein n=1 Tax=Streptococcus azizii TaxID=1579424 RepID=A0AB36JPT3_9STRE|nr:MULTISPECIES: hypothetical protein [Streptococcus]MBF0775345.1 hypothetical protein [Streptococcus sp. 19428wD3_AN2]ONK29615.1 hypothetical protein BVE86_00910 [Streptococcus azizii]ONK30124.1 hypothetical protein BVE85_02220 [Streptococcus azizii]ONK30899.1 hypothetical protein BVE84_02220 [Streptococcus azizii]TFU84869.1 hypothetical protein E4T83_00920 [Streptococcus sp. AN2]